jgi:hypothetical protein
LPDDDEDEGDDDAAVGERSDDDEAAAISDVRLDGGATALTTTARGVVLITPTRHCDKAERDGDNIE